MNNKNKETGGASRISRKQQAQERRLEIIDAALKVFAEKGFSNTTIKNISEAAGTSEGLMYHYFQSKEELLSAVLERHSFLPQLRGISSVNPDRPVCQVLYEITIGFYNLLASKKELVSIVIREMQTDPAFKKRWSVVTAEGVALLGNFLAEKIAAGKLKPHNTEVAARSILYTVLMLFVSSDLFSKSNVTIERFLKEMVDIFLNGISLRPE
jgi:AcrR family transcriptional regulator